MVTLVKCQIYNAKSHTELKFNKSLIIYNDDKDSNINNRNKSSTNNKNDKYFRSLWTHHLIVLT